MAKLTGWWEVVKVEKVGPDWPRCHCGCSYPPGEQCPYQEYHDDPTAIDAKPGQWIGEAEWPSG